MLSEDLFLPDPSPREVKYTVISVDDHVVEPPHTFEGRLPAALQERAPRIVESRRGHQLWEFEGRKYTQVGMNAVAGRRPETVKMEPFRFEQMRPGCYDVEARVHDMDLNGVWASLNFPSQITGFCGSVFFNADDRDLGAACIRAWNDWVHDEWYSRHPGRIIPLGIAYLADAEEAAAEIRRNAGRGFTSVTFPERPHRSACRRCGTASTGTRSSRRVRRPRRSSRCTSAARASARSRPARRRSSSRRRCSASSRWAPAPSGSGRSTRSATRSLKIAMSEGGIGWVAMLLDRLDYIVDTSSYGELWDERPSDVLKRNFWFCTLDDPSTIDTRHRIGVENIMIEVDYPHGDSTWPDTQSVIERTLGGLPSGEIRAICCENAARVYRHPLPETVLPA